MRMGRMGERRVGRGGEGQGYKDKDKDKQSVWTRRI